MYMNDWIAKLDDFLKITEHDILTHAGKVSRELADAKAKTEFSKYKDLHKNELTVGEIDFIKTIDSVEKKLLKNKRSIKERDKQNLN